MTSRVRKPYWVRTPLVEFCTLLDDADEIFDAPALDALARNAVTDTQGWKSRTRADNGDETWWDWGRR